MSPAILMRDKVLTDSNVVNDGRAFCTRFRNIKTRTLARSREASYGLREVVTPNKDVAVAPGF